MRPEQRLDQIKPILAEVLQKVDRLIDSQGRILDEVSKIPGIEAEVAKIAGIDANTATTARAVANLTVDLREFKEEVRLGFNEFEQLRVSQEKMANTQQEILALLRARS